MEFWKSWTKPDMNRLNQQLATTCLDNHELNMSNYGRPEAVMCALVQTPDLASCLCKITDPCRRDISYDEVMWC